MAPRTDSGYNISHNKANEVTYKVVKPGQYVIHLRSFQGGFAHSAVEGITSPAYTVFGFKDADRHDDYFWKIIFMSKLFIKSLETITYGIRDGRSISFGEFSDMTFRFPSRMEQQSITEYFKSLDSMIQSTTKRIELLKQMKQACLVSMFPQEGETTPRIRFKGFEGKWKCVDFGSIITECLDKTTSEDEDMLLSSAIDGLYLNSELFSHFRGQSNIGYRKVKKNMLILSTQNLHLGNANVNLRFEHGIVSPAYKIYYIHDCNAELLSHLIKREEAKAFFLNATTSGASVCRKNIVWEDLYKQKLYIPKEEKEQRMIAIFFTSLNKQISLQEQRLEKLKQIKAACLDKMFV